MRRNDVHRCDADAIASLLYDLLRPIVAEAEQQKGKLEALTEEVQQLDERVERLYNRMSDYVVRDDV
jgi:hypothetical protein